MKDFLYKVLVYVLAALMAIIAVAVIYYVTVGVYHFSVFIFDGFSELKPGTYIPLIATLTTAIIGFSVALVTQAKIRNRSIDEAHREKKIETYYDFLKMFQKIQQSIKPEFNVEAFDEIELAKKMMDFQTDITLWASPKVLLAFSNFQSVSKKEDGGLKAMFEIDAIYRAMRSDIGLSNKGLKKDHFIKSMLTDPDDLDNMRN